MLQFLKFNFNAFSENTYVVYDELKKAVIIDPGCSTPDECDFLVEKILENELVIKKLVNTHCHIDHVLGNAFVKKTFTVPLYIHKLEIPVLESCRQVAQMYGFSDYLPAEPDNFFEEGELLVFGESALDILWVPGHAPGHVAFYHAESKLCFSGDVLFKESIGRSDFPLCNHQDLINSIQQKMYNLPDDTVIWPGHGPKTTIGYEKLNNPFVKAIYNPED